MTRLKRYRYPLIGLGLSVLLLAVWNGLQFFSTSSRINSASYAKIKKGMTQEEVHSILGTPRDSQSVSALYHTISIDSWDSYQDNPPPWIANATLIIIEYVDSRAEVINLTVAKRKWKNRFENFIPDCCK